MKKKWTHEEDMTLLHCVASYPKIIDGCRQAAKELNRTVESCRGRLQRVSTIKKIATINVEEKPGIKKKKSLWQKILSIFR